MMRVNIAGTPIDTITAEEAALWSHKQLKDGVSTRVAPVNAAVVVMASRDPDFRHALERFELALADGLWPALAARFLFKSRVPHANTSPFLKAFFRESSPDGLSVSLRF